MDDFTLLSRAGTGSYAVVWKARRKSDNRTVAIKQLKEVGADWAAVLESADVKYPRRLNHPNVLRLLSLVRMREGSTFIVMEWCDLNLYQLLRSLTASGKGSMTEPEVRWVMRRLLQGLQYCHSQGIMHRDVKPENLLLTFNDAPPPQTASSSSSSSSYSASAATGSVANLKLCDFGQARQNQDSSGAAPLSDYVSTRWYRAPEVTLRPAGSVKHRYGPAVDIWACGCVMAELLTLRPLFPAAGGSEADLVHRWASVLGPITASNWPEGVDMAAAKGIDVAALSLSRASSSSSSSTAGVSGLAAVLPRSTSPAALQAIAAMLTYDPKTRPTAAQVLAMPFFTSAAATAAGFAGPSNSSMSGGGEVCPVRPGAAIGTLATAKVSPAEEAAARSEAEAENRRIQSALIAQAKAEAEDQRQGGASASAKGGSTKSLAGGGKEVEDDSDEGEETGRPAASRQGPPPSPPPCATTSTAASARSASNFSSKEADYESEEGDDDADAAFRRRQQQFASQTAARTDTASRPAQPQKSNSGNRGGGGGGKDADTEDEEEADDGNRPSVKGPAAAAASSSSSSVLLLASSSHPASSHRPFSFLGSQKSGAAADDKAENAEDSSGGYKPSSSSSLSSAGRGFSGGYAAMQSQLRDAEAAIVKATASTAAGSASATAARAKPVQDDENDDDDNFDVSTFRPSAKSTASGAGMQSGASAGRRVPSNPFSSLH